MSYDLGGIRVAHILIIDDEAHIRFLIRKVLESAGHTIGEARNGLEALHILETRPNSFDLAFLDIGMPEMNGIEFLSRLGQRQVSLPIVVLTAHWDRIPLISGYKISGHLFKPFSRQKMLDLVNQLTTTKVAS
jgi:two-component system OmpR family response regulator